MKEEMFRTDSSSSLSDTWHRLLESILLCLLNSFSFLILILPCSVLSTICLKSSIFGSPRSWSTVEVCTIVGSSRDRSDCSLLCGGCFPDLPLRMVIVKVIVVSSEKHRRQISKRL